MLSALARSRLCVVLVGARNPQNIGAAARAMQDFGFTDLRIVNEFAPPFEAAQLEAKSAVGADSVMHTARLFASLGEAVADCHLVVGTTAIGERDLPQQVMTLQETAPQLRAALAVEEADAASGPGSRDEQQSAGDKHIALLFGSEKTGLTREQLSFCSMLLTIPLWQPQGRHLSMNLGQAVAVCLYELSREGFEGARALPSIEGMKSSAAERERLLDLVLEAMQRSEYARRFPANARPAVVRRLVQSFAGTSEVAATWMGFFKAVLRQMGENDLSERS